MRRAQRTQPSNSGKRVVALDPAQLSTARGGGLDIAVRTADPLAPGMQQQHSEQLVRV